MHWLVELLTGFVVMVAAAVLSQFGLDLRDSAGREPEVRRMRDCPTAILATSATPPGDSRDC